VLDVMVAANPENYDEIESDDGEPLAPKIQDALDAVSAAEVPPPYSGGIPALDNPSLYDPWQQVFEVFKLMGSGDPSLKDWAYRKTVEYQRWLRYIGIPVLD
jgi:hypothetical protein